MENKEVIKSETAPVSQPQVVVQNVKNASTCRIVIIVIATLFALFLCCVAGSFLFARNIFNQIQETVGIEIAKNESDTKDEKKDDNITNNNQNIDGTDYTLKVDGTLPSGFPKDVPLYPDGKVNFSGADNKDASSFSINLSSEDGLQKTLDFYKEELPKNGWEIDQELNVVGKTITATKGTRQFSGFFIGDEKSVNITIGITNQ